MSCHCLLAYRVSVEKSADSLMGVPVYVIYRFSLVVFNICQFDYYVSRCVHPWVYPAWDSASWTWLIISFPMFWGFQLLFLQIFSQVLLLWGPL